MKTDKYIHLEDFERFVRNRFKYILNGEGSIVSRQLVKHAIDDIFSEESCPISRLVQQTDISQYFHKDIGDLNDSR